MIPASILARNWKIITLALLIAAFAVYVIFRESYITEVELRNGMYDAQVTQLKDDKSVLEVSEAGLRDIIEERNEEIAVITDELHNIKTDDEIVQDNPVVIFTLDSEWEAILRANALCDDSTAVQP